MLSTFYENCLDFIERNEDKRVAHYFLLGSSYKVLLISLVYWVFVKIIAPRVMKDREAFDMRTTMQFFNLFQILINIYLFAGVVMVLLSNPNYSDWSCMRNIRDDDMTVVHLMYIYYLVKISDYMDTIFMVLRKNTRQVTFLHVYHHITMTFGAYFFTRFVGGGHSVILGVLNCAVHAVMYFYYFLCAFRPELKKSLWWKKHITNFQMVQFVLLILHFIRPILSNNCPEPKYLLWFGFLQSSAMLILFSYFYIKNYILTPPKVKNSKPDKIK